MYIYIYMPIFIYTQKCIFMIIVLSEKDSKLNSLKIVQERIIVVSENNSKFNSFRLVQEE